MFGDQGIVRTYTGHFGDMWPILAWWMVQWAGRDPRAANGVAYCL